MDTVWRIENRAGEGAYSIGEKDVWENTLYVLKGTTSSRHPCPYDDIYLDFDEEQDECMSFCFRSEASLFEWFDADMLKRLKGHAGIAVYEVADDAVRHGEKQSIFDKYYAVLVSYTEI